MSLRELLTSSEGSLALIARKGACFSTMAYVVTVRWDAAGAAMAAVPIEAADGEVVAEPLSAGHHSERELEIAKSRQVVESIVNAADRKEVLAGSKSTTCHTAIVAWRYLDDGKPLQEEARFDSFEMAHGEAMARLVRDALAQGRLPEQVRREAEAGLAKGYYSRAIGLFELAEEISTRQSQG